MVRKYVRKPGKRAYRNYSDGDLKKAAQCVSEKKMTFREASKVFKISVGAISNYIGGKHKKRPGHPTVFTNSEEVAFVEHIKVMSAWGFPIDSFDLRVLVRDYLRLQERTVAQFVNNLPGEDWALSFLNRLDDGLFFLDLFFLLLVIRGTVLLHLRSLPRIIRASVYHQC